MNIQKYVDCAVFQEHIYAFQSGDLSREDHTLLQQHCDECESCVHLLEVEASFLRALQTRLRPDPAPAELKARIRAELESRTTQRPKMFSWLMSPMTAGLATALLLTVILLGRLPVPQVGGQPVVDPDRIWAVVPVDRTAVLVDYQCDQAGMTVEQQQHCDSAEHFNALKVADGQYMQFDLNDPHARELALAQRRRGERLRVVGGYRSESGTIELSNIEPAADAI